MKAGTSLYSTPLFHETGRKGVELEFLATLNFCLQLGNGKEAIVFWVIVECARWRFFHSKWNPQSKGYK